MMEETKSETPEKATKTKVTAETTRPMVLESVSERSE